MQGASLKKINVVRLIVIEDSTIYCRQSNIFFLSSNKCWTAFNILRPVTVETHSQSMLNKERHNNSKKVLF